MEVKPMKTREESRTILVEAALGALAGAALAVFYGRWRRQRRLRGAKALTTGQVISLGTALAPIVRQFLDFLS